MHGSENASSRRVKVEKRIPVFGFTQPSEYHPVHEGLDLPLWTTLIILVVSRYVMPT